MLMSISMFTTCLGCNFSRKIKHDANIANRVFVSERTEAGTYGYDLAIKKSKNVIIYLI